MFRSRRLVARTTIALLLAAAAAGCGVSSGSETTGGVRVAGGTIVYGHDQEPPCLWGGWVQQAYISRNILDSLVTQTENGDIKPWLATAWTVSEDGLTYTFTLKDGVRFTDGTPLDAQAVVDNFEYWVAAAPQGNSTVQAYIADYYASSRAVDPTHVEVTLSQPYSPLLSALGQAYFGIQSPASLRRTAAEICEKPIGSGAFSVAQWKKGEQVDLVRNPDYSSWPATARHQGPAYVDTVIWKFLHDPVARYASLGTGESQVIYDVPTLQWPDAQSRYQVLQYITPGRPVQLSLNTVKGVFVDPDVRRAFAYGADRKAAVEAGFHGVIPYEGNGFVSSSTPGYDAVVAQDYAYDPERAAQLLDGAGWTRTATDGVRTKNGEPLTVSLVYPAGAVFTAEGSTVLQILQEQWKQLGFDVTLVPETQAETFAGKHAGPDGYDAQSWYWTSPTAGILYIIFRQNLPEKPNFSNSSFYNNPELEQIIRQANAAQDPAEANRYYAQAQRILSDDVPQVGLYTQTTSLAVAKDLVDVWVEDTQGEPVFSDAYFTR